MNRWPVILQLAIQNCSEKLNEGKNMAKRLNNSCHFMQLQCSLHWNTVLSWEVKVSPGWLESLWVTSLKSLLQGTDLLLTFNRVRIPCITVFSLFASGVASDTVYPNLSCCLSPLVRLLPRCVQTSQWFELKVQAVVFLSRSLCLVHEGDENRNLFLVSF